MNTITRRDEVISLLKLMRLVAGEAERLGFDEASRLSEMPEVSVYLECTGLSLNDIQPNDNINRAISLFIEDDSEGGAVVLQSQI